MVLKSPGMTFHTFNLVLASLVYVSSLLDVVRASHGHAGGKSTHSPHFVRVQGTKLMLGDSIFAFQGTNNFYLAQAWMGRHRVEKAIHTHAKAGLTVIRLWPFGDAFKRLHEDWHWMDGLAGGLGSLTFSKEAFQRLDWVLHIARQERVKLIMPFINFEDNLFSIRWFVEKIRGQGAPKELFYCDTAVLASFKLYVFSILYHINQYNGRQYRHDDTILGWDLMNEPHTSDAFEANQSLMQGDALMCTNGAKGPVGSLVHNWLCHMSTFVRANDPNHLVTSGEEGYRALSLHNRKHIRGAWIDNGLKGVDFAKNAQCPGLSFLTVHVYPDNWNIPYSEYKPHIRKFLETRRNIAHSAEKPIIMEEYGCCYASDYDGKRQEVLEFMHNETDALGYAGTVVWSLAHDETSVVGVHYGFSYTDPAAGEVTKHARLQRDRATAAENSLPAAERDSTQVSRKLAM